MYVQLSNNIDDPKFLMNEASGGYLYSLDEIDLNEFDTTKAMYDIRFSDRVSSDYEIINKRILLKCINRNSFISYYRKDEYNMTFIIDVSVDMDEVFRSIKRLATWTDNYLPTKLKDMLFSIKSIYRDDVINEITN